MWPFLMGAHGVGCNIISIVLLCGSVHVFKGFGMIDKLKRAGLFAFLFFFFAYRIFFPDLFTDMFADKCDLGYIDKEIEKVFYQSPMNSKQQRLFAEAKAKFKKLEILSEQEEQAFHDFLVYFLLENNNCDVPKDIENKIFKYIIVEEEKGYKTCPKDTHLKDAEKEVDELVKNKAMFKLLEQQIYAEVIDNVDNPELAKLLEKKWKSEEYRKRLVVVLFQVMNRKKNGCKDSYQPMKYEVKQLFKEVK
ncbi:MAG: hypothetical protein KAJ29_06635 [Alphaproteobacteria bacterium]|nr:hypothetical protein [Alphaproteobacteria bacterium]